MAGTWRSVRFDEARWVSLATGTPAGGRSKSSWENRRSVNSPVLFAFRHHDSSGLSLNRDFARC